MILSAVVALVVCGCGSKTASPEDVMTASLEAMKWADALNQRSWDALELSYGDTVVLNGVPMDKQQVLDEKSAFFREHYALLAVVDVNSWVIDSTIGKEVSGHFMITCMLQDFDGTEIEPVHLLLRQKDDGGWRVVKEEDVIAKSLLVLEQHEKAKAIGEGPFGSAGDDLNKRYWDDKISQLKGEFEHVYGFTLWEEKEYYVAGEAADENYGGIVFLTETEHHKVGLVDASGKTLIPLKYDLIGNINSIGPNLIEVFKGGKSGLYTLDGKQLAAAEYDRILPVSKMGGNHIAWLEKGDEYFGLTTAWKLEPIEQDKVSFGQMMRQLNLEKFFVSGKTYPDAPVPWLDQDYFDGNWKEGTMGILITPGFLQVYKGFPEASMLTMDYNHQIPSLTIQSVKPVGEDKLGVLALFDYWGAGGRDVYHATDKRMFTLDVPKAQQISEVKVEDHQVGYTCDLISLDFVADNVLESVEIKEVEGYHEFPVYTYYTIDENGTLSKRPSDRKYPFTEYYELTDAFFKGCFEKVDPKYKKPKPESEDMIMWMGNHDPGIKLSHLPFHELEIMMNEILASYGQAFEGEWKAYFEKKSWYKPQDGDATERMNARDKGNVEFIRSYLNRMAGKEKQLMFPEETQG